MIEVVTEFIAKSTVKVWAYVYDEDGALADPTTITVSINDSAGDAVITDQAMTQSATGIYYYYHRTTTSTSKENYIGEVTVTDGSGGTAIVSTSTFGFRIR